jgi:hypothetical protein
LEEVAVSDDHKVLMEVYNNNELIVGNAKWILDQQLMPHPIHLFNIIIILVNYTENKYY